MFSRESVIELDSMLTVRDLKALLAEQFDKTVTLRSAEEKNPSIVSQHKELLDKIRYGALKRRFERAREKDRK